MKKTNLYDYQIDAVTKMKNGCILCGGVGSGKSRTALAYYYLQNEGTANCLTGDSDYVLMHDHPKDLYIITTPRKRDTSEWLGDMAPFLINPSPDCTPYKHKVIIDSWNNIKKYIAVSDSFFIFDEDRVCGKGAWVTSFLQIAKQNQWVILSATPGDTWADYIPVFIANGFYKNRTEFNNRHTVWARFTRYPRVEKYIDTGILIKHRNDILIGMDFKRQTIHHDEDIFVGYNVMTYKDITKSRWDPYKNKPIENAGEFCFLLRKIVNSDESRQIALLEILENHSKAIIFYNYDYELDILKNLCYDEGTLISEWNGHNHEPIPTSNKWVYFVQYTAGADGWNCVETDTIIFFSQNYSYKVLVQAKGRVDRLNTPYIDLYYYHFRSRSGIDLAITRALHSKKEFNESGFYTHK